MTEHFRRTDPRFDRSIEVEVTVDGQRRVAVTRNISLGGMFIQAAQGIAVASTVTVHFQVPTQAEPIEVTGEVRWEESERTNGMVGIGIRFHGLRAKEVWALNRFFQS